MERKIAVLGSGNVGRTLAAGFRAEGHDVVLCSRDPGRPSLVEWAREADVALVRGADVLDPEVVVLATAWEGAEAALASVDRWLDDVVLLDVSNPLRFTDRLELAVGFSDSGGEQVQRWAPTARVVKGFNTVGWEMMIHPVVDGAAPTMFLAADDAGAKDVVAELAVSLGWTVHDCGDLRAARLTEPLAMLWIEHAIRSQRRSHTFRLSAG